MSNNSSSISDELLEYLCSTVKSHMNTANFTLRVILLLPLSTLVLYMGYQQWKQQCSLKSINHADVFTYHVAVIELTGALGCICYLFGTYSNNSLMVKVGLIMCSISSYGEMCFHVLTCVERYLAVVHPIVYMGLRNAHGVRIRNIIIGCVWLLCFGLMGVYNVLSANNTFILILCCLVFTILIITFCSLSVLCVLIRPRLGECGREKEKPDQLKLRAFHTITAILGVLWLCCISYLIGIALNESTFLSKGVKCVIEIIINWFNLPSSLILLLLYLQRTGKLSYQ